MAIADDIKQLRKQLGLTQEQLGQQLGVAGRVVRRWEAKVHHPDPKYLLGLASLAADAGLAPLASRFQSALIRNLGLVEREMLQGYFDVPAKGATPRGVLLVVRHGREETLFLEALFYAISALRHKDESVRERARAALKQLAQAMGVEDGTSEQRTQDLTAPHLLPEKRSNERVD